MRNKDLFTYKIVKYSPHYHSIFIIEDRGTLIKQKLIITFV